MRNVKNITYRIKILIMKINLCIQSYALIAVSHIKEKLLCNIFAYNFSHKITTHILELKLSEWWRKRFDEDILGLCVPRFLIHLLQGETSLIMKEHDTEKLFLLLHFSSKTIAFDFPLGHNLSRLRLTVPEQCQAGHYVSWSELKTFSGSSWLVPHLFVVIIPVYHTGMSAQ